MEIYEKSNYYAKILHNAQAMYNEGRGIDSIRSICKNLELRKFETVKAIIKNEWDKISSYKDLILLLEEISKELQLDLIPRFNF